MVELVVAVRVKTRYGGGREGSGRSSTDNRNPPQMLSTWL